MTLTVLIVNWNDEEWLKVPFTPGSEDPGKKRLRRAPMRTVRLRGSAAS